MKTRSSYAALLALLLALGTISACSRAPSDSDLADQVRSRVSEEAQVSDLNVSAENGIVTLAGTAASEQEREQAARHAARVEGVKTVVNNLQVTPETAMESEPEQPQQQESRPAPTRRQSTPPSTRPRDFSEEEATPRRSEPVAQTPTPAPATPAAPAPQEPRRVTIPAGTEVVVRMISRISTEENQVGDTFLASLDSPLTSDGTVVVPVGADIEGRIVHLASAGRMKGRSELTLELSRLIVDGRSYDLTTSEWAREGSSRGKRTAATIGGGAALGAIIGGIAGGGKGAAIGAAAGAGAGTGVQAATKGQQIEIEPEQSLTFTLQAPITVTVSDAGTRRRRLP